MTSVLLPPFPLAPGLGALHFITHYHGIATDSGAICHQSAEQEHWLRLPWANRHHQSGHLSVYPLRHPQRHGVDLLLRRGA